MQVAVRVKPDMHDLYNSVRNMSNVNLLNFQALPVTCTCRSLISLVNEMKECWSSKSDVLHKIQFYICSLLFNLVLS